MASCAPGGGSAAAGKSEPVRRQCDYFSLMLTLQTSMPSRPTAQSTVICCVTKPVDVDQFLGAVMSIEAFWLYVVRLPEARPA